MSEALWACHVCGMIGSEADARSHACRSGHGVEELDADTSRLVREEWARMGDPRTVTAHALANAIAVAALQAGASTPPEHRPGAEATY